jgi:hypothetical protein
MILEENMGRECAYSFKDLYLAAHGHPMPREVEQQLYRTSQAVRNEWVGDWAKAAGWETQPRTGTDEQLYLAFCPGFLEGKVA